MFLLASLGVCFAGFPARAADLDAGGMTFGDFAINDNGASFNRGVDPIIAGGPNQVPSRVAVVDSAQGLARVQFGAIKVELALPLGWQATEDWERGVAYSGDKRYRLIIWRVDFTFEGVKDAEHYAATKTGSIQARPAQHPGSGAQARRRHVPDRLRERAQGPRRQRAAHRFRPRHAAAGQSEGGAPADPGRAGQRRGARDEAVGNPKSKHAY